MGIPDRVARLGLPTDVVRRCFTAPCGRTATGANDFADFEWVGDSALGLIVRASIIELRSTLDRADRGHLEAELVRNVTLSALTAELGIRRHHVDMCGACADCKAGKRSADVFEALVGAVVAHQGLDGAAQFVQTAYGARLQTAVPRKPRE